MSLDNNTKVSLITRSIFNTLILIQAKEFSTEEAFKPEDASQAAAAN